MRLILSRLLWEFDLLWDDSKSERYTWESQGTFALWPLWNKKWLVVSVRERRGEIIDGGLWIAERYKIALGSEIGR